MLRQYLIQNYVIYVCIQISKVHPHTALKIIYNLIYCFVLSTTICDNFIYGQYYTVKERIMHLQTFDENPSTMDISLDLTILDIKFSTIVTISSQITGTFQIIKED